MIKLKDLIKESNIVNLGQRKVTIRQVDMYYTLYKKEDGTILAYPQDQSRLFEMINKFGEKEVISPLTNIINNVYGESGFYTLRQTELDVTKPIEYIFIKNN